MDAFRQNPSAAESERELALHEYGKYRRYFRMGLAGLASIVLVIVALSLGWLPQVGDLQVWAIGYVCFGLPVFGVVTLTGFTKGRDYRPSVMEMFAAGGRR